MLKKKNLYVLQKNVKRLLYLNKSAYHFMYAFI